MELKKYALLRRPLLSTAREAYRIKALRDIPEHGVKKGDLGGYIRHESNLSQAGSSWVADSATVLDNAKVRGNALVKGNSVLSDYAIAEGNAEVGGYVHMKDSSIIRGNAKFAGFGSMSDTSLLEGDVTVRHNIDLVGDEHVDDQKQLPWHFQDARHEEPGYLGRLKAAQGDPAFQRFFRSLGATNEKEQWGILNNLWVDDPEGRLALQKIGQEIGGSFYGDEYVPLTSSEATNRRTLFEGTNLRTSNVYGLRRLNGVENEVVSMPLGSEIVNVAAGDVVAELDNDGRKLYQPALVITHVETGRNAYPVPQTVQVIDETFTSFLDARQRASEYLEVARSAEPDISRISPPEAYFGKLSDQNVNDLPLATSPSRDSSGATIIAQKSERVDSGLISGLKVEQPREFSAIRVGIFRSGAKTDLSSKIADLEFHTFPEDAVADTRLVFDSVQDLRSTLSTELSKRSGRLHEIDRLVERENQNDSYVLGPLLREKEALSPAGQPVLDQIGETAAGNLGVKDLLRPLKWEQDGAGGFKATSLGVEVTAKPENGLWRVSAGEIGAEKALFAGERIASQEAAFEAGEELRADLLQPEFAATSNVPAVYRVQEPGEDYKFIPASITLNSVGFDATLQDKTYRTSSEALDEAKHFAKVGDMTEPDLDDRASMQQRQSVTQRAAVGMGGPGA